MNGKVISTFRFYKTCGSMSSIGQDGQEVSTRGVILEAEARRIEMQRSRRTGKKNE
jgi:hypothetical protein